MSRRLYSVILSNPSKDNKNMKHRKHTKRHARSNPGMGEVRRAGGVALKVAIGAIAGAAGIQALGRVSLSERNRTIAIAAGGLVLGGALIATGKAPNLGAGVVASAATVTAQRAWAMHGVGAYMDRMSGAGGHPPTGGLPSGYVVSQLMPGARNPSGFTVAEPMQRMAVAR